MSLRTTAACSAHPTMRLGKNARARRAIFALRRRLISARSTCDAKLHRSPHHRFGDADVSLGGERRTAALGPLRGACRGTTNASRSLPAVPSRRPHRFAAFEYGNELSSSAPSRRAGPIQGESLATSGLGQRGASRGSGSSWRSLLHLVGQERAQSTCHICPLDMTSPLDVLAHEEVDPVRKPARNFSSTRPQRNAILIQRREDELRILCLFEGCCQYDG